MEYLNIQIFVLITDKYQVPGVRCLVSHITCHQLLVTTNSHSHGPSPTLLPHYAHQDAPADLDLDPSTTRCKDHLFFLICAFLGQNYQL